MSIRRADDVRDEEREEGDPSYPEAKAIVSKGSWKGGGTRPRSPPKLYQIAKVTLLATEVESSSSSSSSDLSRSERLSKVDRGLLERIRKSLRLAQHPGTGEAEARQALRLSTRLMASQNLTQADLIAEEGEQEKLRRAGLSEVEIRSTTPEKKVRNESWSNRIAVAINLFFSVKSYSTSLRDRSRLTWTFYGLAINTVAAAVAFEMVHNQVLTWSSTDASLKGRVAKNSYCQGVGAGLIAMAKSEKEEEMKLALEAERDKLRRRIKAEGLERKAELDRLSGPPPPTPSTGPRLERDGERRWKVKVEDDQEEQGTPRWDERRRRRQDFGPTPSRSCKLETSLDAEASSDLDSRGRDQTSPSATVGPDDDDDQEDAKPFPEVKADFDEDQEDDIEFGGGSSDQEEVEFVTIKPKPDPVELKSKEQQESSVVGQAEWRNSGQLIRFRQDAERIADDFLSNLKRGGIRFRKRQERSYLKDEEAYHRGRRDAGKIDVKRKRIQA
ncbi:hypothetical protein IE53DRAFT_318907 [Violaceomyces palustris]|uniref:Uncharacterized protein n=1 Tax=Violaceomyces palustris TaxID=1673888 RepID=A0ACD0NSF6_9BASI|nr:hypothetical protein IE53DRAFT_318907 [Violaceomyces palustris]